MALTYPGRTFSGSKKPSEWFGNVTPAKPTWKPRGAAEGGGMPTAGYIPGDMWAALRAQAPGDLGGVQDPEEAAQQSRAWAASNDMKSNIGRGREIIKGRQAKEQRALMTGIDYDQAGNPVKLAGPTIAARGRSLAASHANDMSPWGDFYAALIGKEANTADAGMRMRTDLTGIGRWKAQDVPTGKVYDLQSGEMAPGLRGAAPEWAQAMQGLQSGSKGWYTPDEWAGMGNVSRSKVRGSAFNF